MGMNISAPQTERLSDHDVDNVPDDDDYDHLDGNVC